MAVGPDSFNKKNQKKSTYIHLVMRPCSVLVACGAACAFVTPAPNGICVSTRGIRKGWLGNSSRVELSKHVRLQRLLQLSGGADPAEEGEQDEAQELTEDEFQLADDDLRWPHYKGMAEVEDGAAEAPPAGEHHSCTHHD